MSRGASLKLCGDEEMDDYQSFQQIQHQNNLTTNKGKQRGKKLEIHGSINELHNMAKAVSQSNSNFISKEPRNGFMSTSFKNYH